MELLLSEARSQGLVGPGPVSDHLDHARGFQEARGAPPQGVALDLGSGAGLPGLPLALTWPQSCWVLLDSGRRRAMFLRGAVARLGLEGRVRVEEARAEEASRRVELRSMFSLVVARGFGSPAVTAECAAGFLEQGGHLVVSEPPVTSERWSESGLTMLGMRKGRAVETTTGSHLQIIEQLFACPDRYPRRVGIPGKRPLF